MAGAKQRSFWGQSFPAKAAWGDVARMVRASYDLVTWKNVSIEENPVILTMYLQFSWSNTRWFIPSLQHGLTCWLHFSQASGLTIAGAKTLQCRKCLCRYGSAGDLGIDLPYEGASWFEYKIGQASKISHGIHCFLSRKQFMVGQLPKSHDTWLHASVLQLCQVRFWLKTFAP